MTEKYTVKLGNKMVHKYAAPIEAATSNEAEYVALLLGMEWCHSNEYDQCRFLCDSRFVVCGVTNPKKHSKEALALKQTTIKAYLEQHPNWVVEWISRGENSSVDALSRMNPAASVETFKQE
jgi:ribonuclease HI